MKTMTKSEALSLRTMREARYGTIDKTYIVQRVARGKWRVRPTQRPVGLRRLFEREQR